jgi:glycosyltransferase involved in cell wall biosynthesis
MKKITYIATGLYTGGAEIMLYHLLSKINREKFSPTVISLIDGGIWGDKIKSLGIPVYTIGMKPGIPSPVVLLKLVKKIIEIKPDIIQGWMYHGNIAAKFVSFLYSHSIPVFWSIHHSINSLKQEKKMTQLIIRYGANIANSINKVIFVSQNSKIQHEQLGYSSTNSYVIPNGFDVLSFQPSLKSRLDFRQELSLPEDSILIGLICRFHPMKDHLNFLEASALLSKKYSDIQFVLVGTNVDRENNLIEDKIKVLGLENKIHLLGERQDIPNIIPALDIMTMSSAYGEAFPLIIGESMSCGVTCVVTDVGDASWIVGDTGKVVPPKSPEALADAWQELILMGSQGRQKLGLAARARVVDLFSLDSIVAKYEHLYESV